MSIDGQQLDIHRCFTFSSLIIFFTERGMKCGFCKEEGHNLAGCKANGASAEREQRKSDPKNLEKKERAKNKKEEEAGKERERLRITKEKKDLHVPTITPGHVNIELVPSCQTVCDVISMVLPDSYLQRILDILNTNRSSK